MQFVGICAWYRNENNNPLCPTCFPPLPLAMQTVIRELRKDSGYFYGWQANIAMAFQDECDREKINIAPQRLHLIANQAAINFLKMLTR